MLCLKPGYRTLHECSIWLDITVECNSNQRPSDLQSDALPTELLRQCAMRKPIFGLKQWETVAEAVYLCAIELIINVWCGPSLLVTYLLASVYP